jgi:hypothetical protein
LGSIKSEQQNACGFKSQSLNLKILNVVGAEEPTCPKRIPAVSGALKYKTKSNIIFMICKKVGFSKFVIVHANTLDQ